jgi:hypothetical protein
MLLILFFWFYHANIKKLSGKYTQPIQFFILFIIIIDLAYLDISLINFKDKEDIFYKTDLINYLESDKDKFRILDLAEAMPFFEKYGTNSYPLETLDVGFAKFDGLRSTNAIGRLIIDIPNNKIANFELLNLINVKYIILPYSLEKEGYSLVYHSTIYPLNIWGKENVNSEIFVYRNEKFLPRAFIVHAYHLETKTNMLSIMNASTSFREVVLLDEKPEINYTSKAACQTNVSIISISSTRAVFDTCLSEPGFLVFTDSYYPGWKAYIDGKETKVYRANYAFKAVVADAGQHEIIFEFKPTLFSKLSYLSIISFSLVILLLLVLIFRRKIK